MIRTVRNLLTIDPGFRADGVLTMRVSTPSIWYPDSVRVVVVLGRSRSGALSALPGVKRAAAVRLLPLATRDGRLGPHDSRLHAAAELRARRATGRS